MAAQLRMDDDMSDRRPIGVYDSGVGGLTVVKEMEAKLPDEAIIYFGDTARAPYGEKTQEQIRHYSRQIIEFFRQLGVKMVVAACNTSSALALPDIGDEYPFPIVGVIDPGVRAALRVSGERPIGLWATEATVASGAYERKIRSLDAKAKVISVACPKLVPMIESGQLQEPDLSQVLREYLEPVLTNQAGTLILGCTHYPFLSQSIRALAPELTLVDPAAETVVEVRSVLDGEGLGSDRRQSKNLYYVSGEPEHFATRSRVLAGKEVLPQRWVEPGTGDGE